MDSLVQDVEDLLRHVAEHEIMTRFGKLQAADIHSKDLHGDVVTTADLEAENRIREGLLKLRPDSVFIGEESAHKTPDILQRLHGDKPVWVVDPVDGTRNFSKSKPCFAVICALVEGGETQMGWILDPISGVCITACLGAGTYLEDQRLTLRSPPDGFKYMTGSVGEGLQKQLKKHPQTHMPARFVRYHCVGREYMDLALSKLSFALYGGKKMPWDHAAGVLLVKEAGGFVAMAQTKTPYSPLMNGPGEDLLMASNEAIFDSLAPLFTEKQS